MVYLRKIRIEKGLSMNQLSKESGVERTSISNIENGHYKTATPNMKKLADYFGIKEPLELTENVWDLIKTKSCLNQRCPLNKECYCQSEQVCNGAFCQNEYVISNPVKAVRFNNTQALFID